MSIDNNVTNIIDLYDSAVAEAKEALAFVANYETTYATPVEIPDIDIESEVIYRPAAQQWAVCTP